MTDLPTGFLPDYAAFARAVYQTGILSDPWLYGEPRFSMNGVVLTPEFAGRLAEVGEAVAYLHEELVEILSENQDLVSSFFRLTPWQRLMWEASGGLWHGMARADVFECEDGRLQCCELNSDTPSGQPEAVILNRLLHANHPETIDPNEGFGDRFVEMLRESNAKRTTVPLKTAAIIYPTELTEDLGMIAIFTRWLEAAGIRVVAGSPFNIRRTPTGITVFGETVDVVVRHYKTDWWGEREVVWADAEDYLDDEPLEGPLVALLDAEVQGQVTVVNPFGAVITQNKLSLAFFWEEKARFSPEAQELIERFIPETRRMAGMSHDRLRAEREQWVLKSDYGCEGAETVCGPFVTQEIWEKTVDLALPEHFVAQKFFTAKAYENGYIPNYGVFILGGGAAGYFTRLSKTSTEYSAVTVPTYIASGQSPVASGQ